MKKKQHPEAVGVLNLKFEEFRSLIETLRLRVQLLDLKAALLSGAYVIFQTVLYAQIHPISSASACVSAAANSWVPVCLSASISVAFWPAFIDTVSDCMSTRQQQESSFIEQEKLYRQICSARDALHVGSAVAQQSLTKLFASERRHRRAYVGALYSSLVLFTVCVSCVLLTVPGKARLSGFHLIRSSTAGVFFN